MKDSGTLLPLLAGRLWSSFNNSLRFSRKASTIPRGLFGLATNTCLAQEKDPRKQLIWNYLWQGIHVPELKDGTLKTWNAHILIFLLESYRRCRLVVTTDTHRKRLDVYTHDIYTICAELENLLKREKVCSIKSYEKMQDCKSKKSSTSHIYHIWTLRQLLGPSAVGVVHKNNRMLQFSQWWTFTFSKRATTVVIHIISLNSYSKEKSNAIIFMTHDSCIVGQIYG
jgi:hypothetical protein